MFRPKLLTTLRGYTRKDFVRDLIAGTIVGVVALPLAIAFAIASGVSPEKGLITAVIAGFLVSALGGSRVQIGGPTGAFIVIVYGIVAEHGETGLVIATLIAGALLVMMGLARLGSVIKFIPHPVIVGFTSGIAVIIFSSQIKDILGLSMGDVPADFIEKWAAFGRFASTVDPASVAVGLGSLLIITLWPRITHRIPGTLVALILATAATSLLHLDIATIGSRFGAISATFPTPTIPAVDFATIRSLFGPAVAIALLAAIESLLSAVVADGMIGGRHRSNTELIAQGISNLVAPLFGGIPATGAIARTATNIRNGGRTPVAGLIHAVVLLAIMLFVGKWATLIPLPCLAAILVVVAYNMSEWRTFGATLKSPRSDVIVLLSTFVLTVIIDLTVAIEVGMVVSVLLFIRRMMSVTNVQLITSDTGDDTLEGDELPRELAIPGVEIYEINGPLFFGAVYKFEESMHIVEDPPPARILRMRYVPAIDATGLHALSTAAKQMRSRGGVLVIAEIHAQPFIALEKSGVAEIVGTENVFGSLDEALERARAIVAAKSA